jgi:phosphotransferase system HPr-like phosphotransfer protein
MITTKIICEINLQKINDIREFLKIIRNFENNYYLENNTYRIDAKSVMGIFSLNLSQNLKLTTDESTNDIVVNTLIQSLKDNNINILI